MDQKIETIEQFQLDIANWMRVVGQEVLARPGNPKERSAERSLRLVFEEALELAEGMGYRVMVKDGELRLERVGSWDLEKVYDAVIDLFVVVYGVANTFGLNVLKGLQEVMKSNWSKIAGGWARESDGKWMKGPGYAPPNLKQFFGEKIGN
jgi:NTP pyrophosphatase (non-canonical NTP hydrolase)